MQHCRLCWKSTAADRNRQQIGNKVDTVNFVADTVDYVASVYGAKATRFNKVDRVEFNCVASVYRALWFQSYRMN